MAPKSKILGIEVDSLTTEEFLKHIEDFIASGTPHQIAYLNADGVNKCWSNRAYRDAVSRADLVYADGMGVVWASRVFDRPLPERVNAGDLLPQLCELARDRQYKIYLLGGEDGIAEQAALQLTSRYPNLQVVGHHHGFFDEEKDGEVLEDIRRTRPDILLVGMGAPKQELWIREHLENLNVPVAWGVGGLLDYCAEKFSRAPEWMRHGGLEWLYRFMLEPRRLWRRYILGNIIFTFRIGSLVVLDSLMASAAWLGAYWTRWYFNEVFRKEINPFEPYLYMLPLIVVTWVVICASMDLYRRHLTPTSLEELASIVKIVFLFLIPSMAVAFLFKEQDPGRSVMGIMAVYAFICLTISRVAWNRIEKSMLETGIGRVSALVVGAGPLGQKVISRLKRHPHEKYIVLGIVDDGRESGTQVNGCTVLGPSATLPEMTNTFGADEIFFADPEMTKRDLLNLVVACSEMKTVRQFSVVTDMFGVIADQAGLSDLEGLPIKVLRAAGLSKGQQIGKRLMDLGISIVMGIFTIPFIPLISLIIKLSSPGPAVFRQRRIGKEGKPFTMYKFRTMHSDVDEYAEAPIEPDDPRIIPIGRWLRRTSLDELPQLWNVIRGEMSMVGPRPEMPFIVENYEAWQRQRLTVQPGITGLWQILGRKDLPLHANLEYDFYYIQNQSLLFDVTILLKTIPV
ncbi:MAG: exopolysaccharide biosynthesis polyprenyl glycosylphosphotransferase, partial [bacterium]